MRVAYGWRASSLWIVKYSVGRAAGNQIGKSSPLESCSRKFAGQSHCAQSRLVIGKQSKATRIQRPRRNAVDSTAPGFDDKRQFSLALRAGLLLQARGLRYCTKSLLLLLERRHARRKGSSHRTELCF